MNARLGSGETKCTFANGARWLHRLPLRHTSSTASCCYRQTLAKKRRRPPHLETVRASAETEADVQPSEGMPIFRNGHPLQCSETHRQGERGGGECVSIARFDQRSCFNSSSLTCMQDRKPRPGAVHPARPWMQRCVHCATLQFSTGGPPSALTHTLSYMQVNKFARSAATTFAPRPSGATKNPAYKGSVLYTIFGVQAWVFMAVRSPAFYTSSCGQSLYMLCSAVLTYRSCLICHGNCDTCQHHSNLESTVQSADWRAVVVQPHLPHR